MASTKKNAAATKPKKTGTKLGTMKVAKATPTKSTKVKRTGFSVLRSVYAEVMAVADAPHKAEVDEDQDYSSGKEDEGQEDDGGDESTGEDQEAEESSGTESEDEGEGKGEGLTARQKRIRAKLDLDPRYLKNRQRALKKHNQIAARIEEDGQVWKDMPDEALGDIANDDEGGWFRLVEDKEGSIVKQPGGTYYDTKTKQSFKKVRKFEEMSASPYADGEIPVMEVAGNENEVYDYGDVAADSADSADADDELAKKLPIRNRKE